MALTEGEGFVTSSYSGSVLSALFVSSLIFALLLIKIITITVMETTTLMIKAAARALIEAVYALMLSLGLRFMLNKSLILPVIFPQTTV